MFLTLAASAAETSSDPWPLRFSAAAVLIALGALVHSIVTARSERGHREETIELVRQQVREEGSRHAEQMALEQEKRMDERRADLSGRQGVSHGGDPDDDVQVFIHNGGRATARQIRIFAVSDDGAPQSRDFNVHDLPPDTPAELRVAVSASARRSGVRIAVRARWVDGAGEQDEELFELKPR